MADMSRANGSRAAPVAMRRAARCDALQLSPIVQIAEQAKRLRAAGQDIISFSSGEPDFPTPPHVVAATSAAIATGAIGYPATQGTLELRNAICSDAQTHCGFSATPAEVIVSAGVKQVLCNALQATLDPDDEVIVPAPYWSTYVDIVAFAGARVIRIACDGSRGFTLQPRELSDAITPRTRWLLLNSPGNPSGKVYSRSELEQLAEVLRHHPQVWVLSDEIYQHISYEPFCSFRVAAPDLAIRTLTANGVSKAYAMMGWRLGWGIGPTPLIEAMTAVQGQSTSAASAVSQLAAQAALLGPRDLLASRRESFRKRRDLALAECAVIDGLHCAPPGGAFYLFFDCHKLLGRRTQSGEMIESDDALCRYLLARGKVALVPGSAFGMPGYLRMSYACSERELREGCGRMAQALAHLR